MVTSHPNFPQPVNLNEKVWRYLSLAKFLNLVLSDSIYFTRIDLLGDSHEGTYTKQAYSFDTSLVQEKKQDGFIESIRERNVRIRKSMFVNCWRIDNYESEAMWKLYCPNNEGIALQTTYDKLANSIPGVVDIYLGLVTYLDYETDDFDTWNLFSPVMHKRKAFEHEKEVRLVKSETKYWNVSAVHPTKAGQLIKSNLLNNIDTLYINPYASEWYFDTVTSILNRLGLKFNIKWSAIKSAPYY